MAVYFASKAYVLSLGEALAHELRGTGVTVTTPRPGQRPIFSRSPGPEVLHRAPAAPHDAGRRGSRTQRIPRARRRTPVVITGAMNRLTPSPGAMRRAALPACDALD